MGGGQSPCAWARGSSVEGMEEKMQLLLARGPLFWARLQVSTTTQSKSLALSSISLVALAGGDFAL